MSSTAGGAGGGAGGGARRWAGGGGGGGASIGGAEGSAEHVFTLAGSAGPGFDGGLGSCGGDVCIGRSSLMIGSGETGHNEG